MMTNNAYKCWQTVENNISLVEHHIDSIETQRLYILLYASTFFISEVNFIFKIYLNCWLDPEPVHEEKT